ncbi:MAG TPA: STAS domain-containing protein [Jatrophihabitans sp.]|jgi:anti-sigma B factor antagonist|nr:STAS domain-containing protein [Jatrophihabitans sp.]
MAGLRTTACDQWRAAIALQDEWDLARVEELRAELSGHLDAGRRVIHVDLGEVTFLDSTMLGELATVSQRCREGHGLLILTKVPPRVRRVIEVAGMDAVLLTDGSRPPDGDAPSI